MAWSWHTKGRRIPTLIGKDVSGRRIPGGPYTGLQALTAVAVPGLLWWTRGLWAANLGGLAMLGVLVGVTVGAVKLAGKADFASRNPLLLLGSYLRQSGRPVNGTLGGRKLVEPRPHRIGSRIEVTYTELGPPAVEAGPQTRQPASANRHPVAPPGVAAGPRATPDLSAPIDRPSSTIPAQPAAVIRPTAPLAPDRRRSSLEAFLAGAAATQATPAEKDAA